MKIEIEKKTCIICGEEYEGYGNNALPIKEGRCCDNCNVKKVIPIRIGDCLNEVRNRNN